jgi:hypothetical protein
MITEWASEETREMIDEALTPTGRALADSWDDDDAWSTFQESASGWE